MRDACDTPGIEQVIAVVSANGAGATRSQALPTALEHLIANQVSGGGGSGAGTSEDPNGNGDGNGGGKE
jgi:hypothetical protein